MSAKSTNEKQFFSCRDTKWFLSDSKKFSMKTTRKLEVNGLLPVLSQCVLDYLGEEDMGQNFVFDLADPTLGDKKVLGDIFFFCWRTVCFGKLNSHPLPELCSESMTPT